MEPPAHILLIDDVNEMALTKVVLEGALPYRMTIARSVAEARAMLAAHSFDLVLVDYGLLDGTAYDLLDACAGQPMIVIASAGEEEVAARAVQLGACDYLIKDPGRTYLKLLPWRVEIALRQVRMGRQLHESHGLFRTMADTAPVMIWMSGLDKGCIYFNKVWLDFTGRTMAQEQGHGWAEGVHPEDLSRCLEMYVSRFDTRQAFSMEYRLRRADGEFRWVIDTGVPHFDETGVFLGYIGSCIDITERKQTESALREREEVLRAFFESPGIMRGVVELVAGDIKHLSDNEVTARFFGRTPEQMRNQLAGQMGVQPDMVRLWIGHYEESRRMGCPVEFEYRHGSGEAARDLRVTVMPLDAGSPGQTYAYAVLDVTDRKREAAALQHLMQGVTSAVGEAFFQSLVAHLAAALHADYVCVGEIRGDPADRMRTIAVCVDGYRGDNFEYDLLDTPCEAVMQNRLCSYPRGVQRQFPRDRWLADMGIEGYIGTALLDSQQRVFGILVALYRRPITDSGFAESMLQIFAVRAAGELERKQTEVRLRESEERFRQVTEHIGEVFWMSDPTKNQMLYISPAYEAIWGRTCESLYAHPRSWMDAIHQDDRDRVLEAAMATQVMGTYDEVYRIVRSDGTVRWIRDRAFPIRDDSGDVYRVVGTAKDITDYKQAEQALLSQQTRLAGILDTAMDAVISVNAAQRIVLFNLAAEAMFGYPAAEALGQPLDRFLPERFRQSHAGHVAQFGHSEGPVRKMGGAKKVMALRASGEEFPVEASISQVMQEDQPFCTVILRDLSVQEEARARQAQLEVQLREAQKLEALGMLTGGIAHDFNNLLTAIIGFSQMMTMTLDQSHPCLRYAEEVLKAGNRGADLTGRLLAFSRGGIVEMVGVPLNRTVESFLSTVRLQVGAGVLVQTVLDPAVGCVRMGLGQLEQILMNLAVNARDAMMGTGTLEIRTARVELDASFGAEGGLQAAGAAVTLTVRDTGSGMDETTKVRLFEPFFTTKEIGKGTGLGLSVVYGIMKQCGGKIVVQSALGTGTTFTLYFPSLPDELQSGEGGLQKTAIATEASSPQQTVLLVDDDATIRTLTRTMLERKGYRVLEASTGDDALRLNRAFADQPIHLLLTDVRMPALSGQELATQVRAARPTIPVLYMSGYTDNPAIKEDLAHHRAGFLKKPFRQEELAAKVQEALAASVQDADPAVDSPIGRRRILVVDDDEQLRTLLTAVLEQAGYEVVAAVNGHSAVAVLTKQPVDVVITDILMSEKDGLEVLQDLHRLKLTLPVIAISGGGTVKGEGYLQLAKSLGAVKILTKPLDLQMLLAAVRDVLPGPQTDSLTRGSCSVGREV